MPPPNWEIDLLLGAFSPPRFSGIPWRLASRRLTAPSHPGIDPRLHLDRLWRRRACRSPVGNHGGASLTAVGRCKNWRQPCRDNQGTLQQIRNSRNHYTRIIHVHWHTFIVSSISWTKESATGNDLFRLHVFPYSCYVSSHALQLEKWNWLSMYSFLHSFLAYKHASMWDCIVNFFFLKFVRFYRVLITLRFCNVGASNCTCFMHIIQCFNIRGCLHI
jgi:hypothetical protein